jgi:hypothetical protein
MRAELRGYPRQVEPIRLAVHRLLDGADPTRARSAADIFAIPADTFAARE